MTWLLGKIGFSSIQFYLTAALIVATATGSAWVAWRVRDDVAVRHELELARAAEKETNRQIAIARDADKIGQQIGYDYGMQFARSQRKVEIRTQTLTREVPKYVPYSVDVATPIPLGFVRVFDAGAAGAADPAGLPIAAGQPNDAASDVKLSEIAAVSAANDDAFYQNADQLIALQGYVARVKVWADDLFASLQKTK